METHLVTSRKRADAVRNRDAILDAAAVRLSEDAGASMADIASAAGVGRVTLYGHFPSRRDLIDATIARAVAEGNVALDAVDLSGDPRAALCRLIASSWLLIEQIGSLMTAAHAELGPERIRELHEQPAARVEVLIRRGQDDGVFRADLPSSWLVTLLHLAMHGAAGEIRGGRLVHTDAAFVIAAGVVAAYTVPGDRVPAVEEWLPS